MKKIKTILTSLISPIAVATPMILSSCSVYTDALQPYTPSYKKLEQQDLTAEQANGKWWEMLNKTDDFVRQEMRWTSYRSSCDKVIGATWITGVSYEAKITQYHLDIKYIDTSKFDNHQISFKFNTEITNQDEYIYKEQKVGEGKQHYSIDLEVKNLKYNIGLETAKSVGKEQHFFIKPEKFVFDKDTNSWQWNKYLENDESITFNIREIQEAYNIEGIQIYENETQEAAVLDATHSFLPELSYAIDSMIGFWSYYLDDCNFIE